ncbi:hypothetical protein [Streptomyces sp. NPDC001530]|uniref:hypothetical protein n=1 Tax=Streptomyces sp. NPDC001530 TaxID=3364582 RepID=UPI0036749073
MPEHVSTFQLIGVPALALVTAVCIVGLGRLRRQRRFEAAVRRHRDTLRAMPDQRPSGPVAESVELTPEEHAAFTGLVRRFGNDSRP